MAEAIKWDCKMFNHKHTWVCMRNAFGCKLGDKDKSSGSEDDNHIGKRHFNETEQTPIGQQECVGAQSSKTKLWRKEQVCDRNIHWRWAEQSCHRNCVNRWAMCSCVFEDVEINDEIRSKRRLPWWWCLTDKRRKDQKNVHMRKASVWRWTVWRHLESNGCKRSLEISFSSISLF